MAVTIDSTGGGTAIAYMDSHHVDYDPDLGRYWICYYDANSTNVVVEYSDNGTTWQEPTSGSQITSTATYNKGLQVTDDGAVWVAYENGSDEPCIRRGTMSGTTMTWSSEEVISTTATSFGNGLSMCVFPEGSGYQAFVAWSAATSANTYVSYANWTSAGGWGTWTEETITSGVACYTSIDFRHPSGSRKEVQASTPDVFVAYQSQATHYYFRKFAYSGGSWTKGDQRNVYTRQVVVQLPHLIYDGTDIIMGFCVNAGGSIYFLQRDLADTTTLESTQSTTSTGINSTPVVTYDSDRNLYFTCINNGSANIRTIKWTRSGSTPSNGSWAGSWTTVEADTPANYSIDSIIGYESGYVEHFWQTTGNDLKYEQGVTLNTTPSQPTWNNADNIAEDVAETLLLDWNFVDADSGDTQSKYKLEKRENNNLLREATDANFETDIGWWLAYEGCAISQSATQAKEGTYSMFIDVTGGVDWVVGPLSSGNTASSITAVEALEFGIPVQPSSSLGVRYSSYGVGHTNDVAIRIDKFNSAGTWTGATSYTPNTNNGSWDDLNATIVSIGATDAYVIPAFYGTSSEYDAGEDVYIDRIQLSIGSVAYEVPDPTWWNGTIWTTEQWVTSGTESATIPASWAVDGDSTHIFSVWTNDGTADSVTKSAPLRVIPSGQDNPTIDTITTITGQSQSITWTVTTQTKYQCRVYRDVGLTNLEYDSGIVVSGTKSHTTPFLEEGSRWIAVQTWNDEGLLSDQDTEAVTVDWLDPNYPVPTITENSPAGAITVGWSNP